MTHATRLVQGRFSPKSLRIYTAALAFFFWGLSYLCWLQFPVENAFSIHTHTFSYLGSFNEDRNPTGWWLFTIAMAGWGLASIPLVRHIRRQLENTAPNGARRAGRCLIAGCIGIILVGLFPDARETLIGPIRWTSLHYVGALVLVLGFLIGIPWTAVLVRRAATSPDIDDTVRSAFKRAWWPHVLFLVEVSVSLLFLIRWEFIYPKLKAAAEAAGQEFGSPWREAMNTIYSFPLWDNLFVQTLFIYFIWTALTLPNQSTAHEE